MRAIRGDCRERKLNAPRCRLTGWSRVRTAGQSRRHGRNGASSRVTALLACTLILSFCILAPFVGYGIVIGGLALLGGGIALAHRLAISWQWPAVIALLLSVASPVFPPSVVVALGLLILVVSTTAIFYSTTNGASKAIVVAFFILALLSAMSIINPNVPALTTGVEGVRKSLLGVSGVILGVALVRPGQHARAWSGIRNLLVLLLIASLVVHIYFPSAEDAIVGERNATLIFDGNVRMSGLFAGPFHVALLAVFLAVTSVQRLLQGQRVLASTAVAALALYALHLSQVRTGIMLTAAILVLLVLIRVFGVLRNPSFKQARNVLLGSLSVAVVGFIAVSISSTSSAIQSLFQLASDDRALNRFGVYDHAWDLFVRSPFIGWGAGSAGDGMNRQFPSGNAVTPHNIFIKYAIEMGILGFLCFVVLFSIIVVRVFGAKLKEYDRVVSDARLALVVIAVFGFSTTIVEATPVMYLMFAGVGVAVSQIGSHRTPDPELSLEPNVQPLPQRA